MERTEPMMVVWTSELPWSQRLFRSGAAGWGWLVVRLLLGWGWLHAGADKVFGSGRAGWLGGGDSLHSFVTGAIEKSKAPKHPAVAYGWYVSVLRWVDGNRSWIAKVVAVGEVLIGVALVIGLLTGIAAALGAVLNLNYILAGSAGVNPVYLLAGVLLMLAWRNAGWIGLDRVALPRLTRHLRPRPHPAAVTGPAASSLATSPEPAGEVAVGAPLTQTSG